jgi:endonuclease/exonuclease/phosphatase family metal-dependent hydrolase
MAPSFPLAFSKLRRGGAACLALVIVLAASPAAALRVVSYNILNYPGNSGSARAQYYRTILAPLNADVIVTQEMSSASGPTQFLNEVLEVLEPGQWATVSFIDGNDTDASLFYKPAKVEFRGQSAFYPNPANHLRFIHVYRIRPVGYASPAAGLRLYTAHLKASTGFEAQRLAECIGIRDSMNVMPAGAHAMLCGDMNFYKASTEPGYYKLLESQANNTGRLYDLLPAGDWHDSFGFAPIHTQSTCLSGTCASGAATGGMDDRFDFILPTYNLVTGQGLSILPGTCIAVGNDGHHFNMNITDPPTIPEGAAYATALQLSSDHLPLRVDLQLPAKIATETSLAFGPVIVGAPTQSQDLIVDNPAIAPADSLNCLFTPPAGFGAPGALAVAAEESTAAPISLGAGASGMYAGDLLIASDAPDDPVKLVALSGTVLDHASASLDSTATVLSATADFGEHEAGSFTEQTVRVHNLGYDELQARLSLQTAVISGGDGRFSIVGGFQPTLIGAAGHGYALAFDDTDAVEDSTYTAILTFTSSDEPLPGAAPQPDLVVSLSARVKSGLADSSDLPAPTVTRLFNPSPNPLAGRTTLRLDMARAGYATVMIFDASGRSIATLARGTLPAGRHDLSWDGRGADGASVGSGIYFVRFTAAGWNAQAVRLVVVR